MFIACIANNRNTLRYSFFTKKELKKNGNQKNDFIDNLSDALPSRNFLYRSRYGTVFS